MRAYMVSDLEGGIFSVTGAVFRCTETWNATSDALNKDRMLKCAFAERNKIDSMS
jgi:hypothetical protein